MMMMMTTPLTEYTPPLRQEYSTSNEGPDGNVNSITVFVRDALGKFFALHVATDANFVASTVESADDLTSSEPVLVVPAASIDQPLLDRIIEIEPPDILGLYLVPQEGVEG